MSAVLSMPSAKSEPSRVAAAEAANRASLTASDRLAMSRERLRQALSGDAQAEVDVARPHERGPASAMVEKLRSIPGAGILIDALGGWWAQQPMRAAGSVALDAATVALRPMAKRNPVGLIAIALFAGGLLAWSRPWRWIFTPALFAGLFSQLFRKSVAKVSGETWMDMLMSVLRDKRAPSSPSAKPTRSAGRVRKD